MELDDEDRRALRLFHLTKRHLPAERSCPKALAATSLSLEAWQVRPISAVDAWVLDGFRDFFHGFY